jgi:hypothetical protein
MGGFRGYNLYVEPLEPDPDWHPLMFRDVGNHTSNVFDVAFDTSGLCHGGAIDVNIGQKNRAIVLYLVGNPKTGHWEESSILQRHMPFTSYASMSAVAARGSVMFAWSFEGGPGTTQENGVYFVERAASGLKAHACLSHGPANAHCMSARNTGLPVHGETMAFSRTTSLSFAVSPSAASSW